MMKKLFRAICPAILALSTITNVKATTPPKPFVEWAAHFNTFYDNNNPSMSAMDWLYDVKQASDGGYIAVGFSWVNDLADEKSGDCEENWPRVPSMIKVDAKGQLLWSIKIFDNTINWTSGQMQSVVEVSDGYVACGYAPNPSTKAPLIVKVSKSDGSILIKQNPTISGIGQLYGIKSIPSNIDNGGFIVCGDGGFVRLNSDLTTRWVYTPALPQSGNTNQRFNSVVPLYSNGSDKFGNPLPDPAQPGSVATILGYAGYGYAQSGVQDNEDAEAIKFHVTGTTGVTDWQTTITTGINGSTNGCFFSTSYPASGGLSVSNVFVDYSRPTTSIDHVSCSSMTTKDNRNLNDFFNNPTSRDNGIQIMQLKDPSTLVAISTFNLTTLNCGNGTCFDDEYADGEMVLSYIDGTTGGPSSMKFIDHCNGGDFLPKFIELTDGSNNATGFMVCGSTADGTILANTADGEEPFIDLVDNTFARQWGTPKTFDVSNGLNSDGMCAFAMDQTADGGFIVVGNDGSNEDDYAFVKYGNSCQNDPNITLAAGYPIGSSPTNITGNFQGTWDITTPVTLSNSIMKFMDTRLISDYPHTIINPTRIVIHPGGSLTLNNCTLENFDGCDASDMWDGIEVWGIPSSSQTPSNLQGVLTMNNSTIKNARIGIRVGDDGGLSGGGIINVGSSSHFINCNIGIQFDPYTSSSTNVSSITNSTFDCTGILKENNGHGFDTHIKLNGVNSPTISNCSFQNSGASTAGYTCNLFGTGISGTNSSLIINRPNTMPTGTTGCNSIASSFNTFSNLDNGIVLTNDPATHTSHRIWFCNFSDVKQGITITNNIDDPEIIMNYFSYTNSLPSTDYLISSINSCPLFQFYYGSRVIGCPDFKIKNNRVSVQANISHSYQINGIWVSESGSAGSPAPISEIAANEFKNQSPGRNIPLGVIFAPAILPSGVFATAIRVDDKTGDFAPTKFINIYENSIQNFDPSVPVSPNANLALQQDWFIDDKGFTTTPVIPVGGSPMGVQNEFTQAGSGSSNTLSFNIFSTNSTTPFSYKNSNPSANTTPSTNHNATAITTTPDFLAVTPEAFFCMGALPAAPIIITGIDPEPSQTASTLSFDIYPNPFSTTATISYSIPQNIGSATLHVYDEVGKEVKVMMLNSTKKTENLDGSSLKPGIYLYTLSAEGKNLKQGKFIVSGY